MDPVWKGKSSNVERVFEITAFANDCKSSYVSRDSMMQVVNIYVSETEAKKIWNELGKKLRGGK